MTELRHLTGLGNEFESEVEVGILPARGNAPQHPARGLFTEQISGSAFTAPRGSNQRTWMYRTRPSVQHLRHLTPTEAAWRTAPDAPESVATQLKWLPPSGPPAHTDWFSSLRTVVSNGDVRMQVGGAVHEYRFASDGERAPVIVNTDGELLFIAGVGELSFTTELGRLQIGPGEIAVIPRGIKFSVSSDSSLASGWVNENFGQPFRLPEVGVAGVNAFAMPQDFRSPVAFVEEGQPASTVIMKVGGRFFTGELDHSPFDVWAWRGNYAPYAYDLSMFCPLGPVLFDHPDPSLGTVLTSPSDLAGTANIDFVIFPSRWLVAEDTFRPPWFHSNTMSEYMGIISGEYDAKPGHEPGTTTLHNQFVPHGPSAVAHTGASAAELAPERLESLAFMLESRYVWDVSEDARTSDRLDHDYPDCWNGLG